MKELYCWDSNNEFKMTYVGVPALDTGGRSAVEVQVILPTTACVGFVNMNLTKNKDKAESVNVLVYR
jgi:hypothetical protein